MSSKNNKLVLDLNKPHVCEFCNQQFARESTLVNHVCEPRRRHLTQNEPHVKRALRAYQIWHNHLHPRQIVPVTYQQFSQSQLYGAFVKIGAWSLEQQVQEFDEWCKWCIQSQTPVDRWCDVLQYQVYLKDLLLNESHLQAIQRSLNSLNTWSEISGHEWHQFFKLAHVNLIITWIQQGRISAWMLYNAQSAVDFLERCSPEQLNLITQVAPQHVWKIRFLRMNAESQAVKTSLAEAGI